MIGKIKSDTLLGDYAMRHFRFHLGTLLLIVLLVAVGFAALRESNEIWESSVFSITLGVLPISILFAMHRTEKRRAFWLGFALFGAAYLAMSLVPPIQSRLITSKALAYLDSKVPRSIPAGFAYFDYDNDGAMDLYVVNNSQPNALYLNRGNGTFVDVTTVSGSNPAVKQVVGEGWVSNALVRPALAGSSGTTENFVKIGHSLLALIVALLGGQLSRHLHATNRQTTS
jgi:hypothetical protein